MTACADTPTNFSGMCTVSWVGQPTFTMPCMSQDLKTPGYNNRLHLLLYPTAYLPVPAVYRMATPIRFDSLADGRMRVDIGFFVHLEMLPNDPTIQGFMKAAAGGTETRPQRVTFNVSYNPQVVEILIEEPTSDEVNHTASFTWLKDLAETFLLLGSVH